MNISFIILGLLYGEGDFEKTLIYTVNCGQDADCTGATVGGFLGILIGAEAIPERWKAPLGEKIVTNDYKDVTAPANLDELVYEQSSSNRQVSRPSGECINA